MAIQIGFPEPYLLTHGNTVQIISPNHDGDSIYYSEQARPPRTQIKIIFTTDPHIGAWKGVEVLDEQGHVLKGLYLDGGDHGPRIETVSLVGRNPNQLSFMLLKAKAFGVHTGMYQIANLGQKAGMTLRFHWGTE